MHNYFCLLIALLTGHFLCDYPLQGDFLSKAKNKFNSVNGVNWYTAMTAHAFIHGGTVMFLTGSTMLGMCEFVVHFVIDYAKCDNRISFDQDQLLHVLCKVLWLSILVNMSIP